jgi:iron complex outermembrane recepter protein
MAGESTASHPSAYNRAPTWDSTAFQLKGAEAWVSANVSQQILLQLQARPGVENSTNQRVTYTDPLTPGTRPTSSSAGAST